MNGGDLTRSTFTAHRHYSGVRMQQGRVQLDADWNEQLDITAHRDRAEATDVIGSVGVPKLGGGFELTVSPDGDDLLISPGRAWVGGHLCEVDAEVTSIEATPSATSVTVASLVLDGTEIVPQRWVEVLSETHSVVTRVTAVDVATRTLSLGASVSALSGDLVLRRRASYAYQPDVPKPEHTSQASATDPRVLDVPDGSHLAYLDVWERPVTALDDPAISEPALGVDTATRSRTVWQLRLLDLTGVPEPVDCDSGLAAAAAALVASTGRLAARAVPPAGSEDLCRPTPAGGYIGLENQLYRIQVHDLDGTRPVILWSRENASVTTRWVSTITSEVLEVADIGKDAVLGFKPGDWVELYDDACVVEAHQGTARGTLVQLLDASGNRLELAPGTATGSTDIADFPLHPQVRRWDSPGPVTVTDSSWLDLEDGVQVRLLDGSYRRGDYWLVPARSILADVDWPQDSGGEPLARLPHGARHDSGRVAIVTATDTGVTLGDCRDRFPALTALAAEDVAVDNDTCELPGVETVQDAIDALCRSNDLRRHNRLLHGYGIVCGLAVHCGGAEQETRERRHVTVQPGSAIDAEGYDLDVTEPLVVDVIDGIAELVEAGAEVLDENDDGEVSLVLRNDPDRGTVVVARTYEPRREGDFLEGTLLKDIYDDCIADLWSWLRSQLTAKEGDDREEEQRAYRLRTALTNLATYVANPKSGGQVFVSETEDELLRAFYAELRRRLRSQTFCAMFDDARPYPDYPESLAGIRTVSGVGRHSRVRLHPGGNEAWTTGSGINPLQPSTMVNRYDVRRETLIARIDPVSGKELEPGEAPSKTAAAVTDVAFSPDGKLVIVAVPTRDDHDTLVRVGEISGDTVRWRPASTICGVKLVTLATTAADPDHGYAVGLRRRTTEKSRFAVKEFEGVGIWRIPMHEEVPEDLTPIPGTETLNPVGHLVITPEGQAVFTSGDTLGSASSYTRMFTMTVPDGLQATEISIDETGSDGLTLVPGGTASRRTVAHVVVGSGRNRSLVAYDVRTGAVVSEGVSLEGVAGSISLATVRDRVVVTGSDSSVALVVDTSRGVLVDGLRIPVQVAPTSVAADPLEPRHVVALNLWSNSLTVVDAKLVMGDSFDLEPLVAYRRDAVEAFADLVGGFAQYLKDCVCDHLLVRCPTPPDDKDLELAAVSIRGGSVHKVCNFSRRRYVKSFPTIGYWLSLVPVLPALREVLGRVCCAVLPEYFGSYSTAGHDEARDRVDAGQVLRLLEMAQGEDPMSKLSRTTNVFRTSASKATAGDWSTAVQPIQALRRPAPQQATARDEQVEELMARVQTLEQQLGRLASPAPSTTPSKRPSRAKRSDE
jgi:hypothetical protein